MAPLIAGFSIAAKLTQAKGVKLTTATPRVAQDGAQLTLAATLRHGDGFALRAEYDGDFRSDYISNDGLIKLNWQF